MEPITVYNEDPDRTNCVEWREVWYCDDERPGTFTLLEMHGWWDNANQKVFGRTQTMAQPCETEAIASKAMDERISWLRDRGWIYKRTGKCLSILL